MGVHVRLRRRGVRALAIALALAGSASSIRAAEARSPVRAPSVSVSVGRAVGQPIGAGFLGLSIEYWAVEAYAGKDPSSINPVLVQLINNLVAGGSGVIRVGGVTTDRTWWPMATLRRPAGVTYPLTASRLAVIKALADATGSRLIMGINLEADSRSLAAAEVRAMLARIGRSRIEAFELGNEPELYGNQNFGWYTSNGQPVPGRDASYGLDAFAQDFGRISAALPGAPLAGPSSGAHRWFGQLGGFLAAQPRIRVVTVHRYPMQACFNPPSSATYPTNGRLLSAAASRGLADSVLPSVRAAHRLHLPLRVDEMNTISCGNPPGVQNTFAMALWVLDALFADAHDGVDGVNIHTYPGAVYQLFTFTRDSSGWQGAVEPEYYGLLMFSQAAPPGSRLLRTTGGSDALRVWATRDRVGTTRVLLLNDDLSASHTAAIRLPGLRAAATLERLEAPSASAVSGVTLAGQTYGTTTRSGLLSGQPSTELVSATSRGYVVRLPPASAALLTIG